MNETKKEVMANPPSATPAEMIQAAVQNGADLTKLEGLLALQERWEANQARKAYHQAMAEFKENPPEIEKDKTVRYKEVKYNHASLANVVSKITKALSQHGLSASWNTHQNGAVTVSCKITHVLGHSEETTLTAPADSSGSKNSIQAIGSTVTYLQRYTLLSALGLATHDQDNDARGDVECINDKELGIIRDMLISLESNEGRFCEYLKVDKLENLPKSEYKKATSALEATKKKRGENENN